MKQIFYLLFCILLSFNIIGQPATNRSPIYNSRVIHHPVVAQKGMVATQHKLATEAGLEILKKGGNAVDAAVAVGFSLAVVLPRAGNLGGGGFMMVHDASSGQTKALNYREMAPGKSKRDMYLDTDGNVDNELLNFKYPASGVPGSVAGLSRALELYGTMSLKEVLKPAIRLAEKGFEVSYDLSQILKALDRRMRKWPESAKIFYKPNGGFYEAGEILVQKDLAWSLKQIAKDGPSALYSGKVGERLADDMAQNGGLITMDDLNNYKVEELEPVWGEYRGFQIASMPPPSSGGVHVIQMLNILEAFPLGYFGHNSAETLHLMTEAMKLAYADRSEHLGDPNFWDVPVDGITSEAYAEDLRVNINRWETNPSSEIKPGNPQPYESDETTHFTVVDAAGNIVVNTYTLNFSFGSGIVAKGTGILLNNEMSDFSAKPGEPDAFGLLGGEANSVQPGKRPLSSMTPTIVLKEGKPYFATGSPGGSRIITTVLQVILNVIDHDMNVSEASHAPRIHHQWYPDILFIEKGINVDTQNLLRARNHKIQYRNAMGSTQTIMLRDGLIFGASDPRRPDALTLGF
jgi:gamma-glutamyltranspeptidase/glutathione hydrolase